MAKTDNIIPNLVIIGDVSYDINKFFYNDGTSEIKVNFGGSSIYASVPASTFFRVGLVSNAGEDMDISKLKEFDIDLRGLHQRKNERTTRFYNILRTKDRQERETIAEYNQNLATKFSDIPEEYLQSKYFYVATMPPRIQLDIIKQLKEKNPNAIIGVDTFEQYAEIPETSEVFNLTDIAFIDKEFTSLLGCNARTKIIKLGKTGCILREKNNSKRVYSRVIEDVVDKTGAGDCLNGVFMNLVANGYKKEIALKKAVEMATLSINDFGILWIMDRLKERLVDEDLEH